MSYLAPRHYYTNYTFSVIQKLQENHTCKVHDLAEHMRSIIDALHIKPLIYHLIVEHTMMCDMYKKIHSGILIHLRKSIKI